MTFFGTTPKLPNPKFFNRQTLRWTQRSFRWTWHETFAGENSQLVRILSAISWALDGWDGWWSWKTVSYHNVYTYIPCGLCMYVHMYIRIIYYRCKYVNIYIYVYIVLCICIHSYYIYLLFVCKYSRNPNDTCFNSKIPKRWRDHFAWICAECTLEIRNGFYDTLPSRSLTARPWKVTKTQ